MAKPSLPQYRLEMWSKGGDAYLSLDPPYDHEIIVLFLFHHDEVTVKKTYIGEAAERRAKEGKGE